MMNTGIINAGIPNYNRLHFGWFLVDWCNYNCSYCCTGGAQSDEFSKAKSPSVYNLVLRRLENITTEFEVDLYGGEPTLHPKFHYILDQLVSMKNCKLVEIKTNLSRSLPFLKKVFDHEKVRLSASYHPEYFNQAFVDKCIALKEYNFYCHINLSDKPKDWCQILDLVDKFDQAGVQYDCNLLYSIPGYDVDYTQEFFDVFENTLPKLADKETYRYLFANGEEKHMRAFDVYKQGLANFKGYKCQAFAYEIKTDGVIKNLCTGRALPMSVKEKDTHSGVICPLTRCESDMMLHFYKEKLNDN